MRPRQLVIVPIMLAVIGLAFAFTIPGTFQCEGSADCFSGRVTKIVDGDTLRVDGQSVRLALVSAPERHERGGDAATMFLGRACPEGSAVLVDEDDGQQEGSYGRIIATVYCNGENLNRALLDSENAGLLKEFCHTSEFAQTEWAKRHGC